MNARILILIQVCIIEFSAALHCLAHDHCGDNAVCVSGAGDTNPKCMCLLGFRGNGADCRPSDASHVESVKSSSVGKTNRQVVTITKCAQNGSQPPPPPPSEHDHHHHHEEHETNDASNNNRLQSAKFTAKEMQGQIQSYCTAVACDFNRGPCEYKNDLQSDWQIRDIETGTVLLVIGHEISDHYLLSGKFKLESEAALSFSYFDSGFGHLRVFSNSLQNEIWNSATGEIGWKVAVIILSPGNHQLVFAAEDLDSTRVVALDNITLEKRDGMPASCQ